MARLAVAGALLFSSCSVAVSSVVFRDAQELDCSKPMGAPLKQLEPFRVCGELVEIVEGENDTLNYYPLDAHSGYTTACFQVNVSRVHFAIDWCSKLVMPVFMMSRIVPQVEFSVTRDPATYMFFGCSNSYRTKFQIMPNVTTGHRADCLTVLSYARNINEPPVLKHRSNKLVDHGTNIFATPAKTTADQRSAGRKRLPSYWITMLLVTIGLVLECN